MHIVAGEVERDEALEEDSPSGESGREENQEAGSCASISHHVKDSTETGRLFEPPRGVTVEGIKKAGYRV